MPYTEDGTGKDYNVTAVTISGSTYVLNPTETSALGILGQGEKRVTLGVSVPIAPEGMDPVSMPSNGSGQGYFWTSGVIVHTPFGWRAESYDSRFVVERSSAFPESFADGARVTIGFSTL